MTMVVSSHLSPPSSIKKYPMESQSIVPDYKSQFIKEGLKMKVRKNMKIESEESLQEILNHNIKQENEVHRLMLGLINL